MKAYASIQALAYALPEQILDNAELAQIFPEWTAEKIFEKTGIRQRHIAAAGQTAADLAVQAAKKLFTTPEISPASIDYLLFCTQTPDYLLPSSACLIHQQLGLSSACPALDLNMGCSGYVYGLSVAKALVESGMANNVLLLTGDTYTKLIAENDRSVRPLFGDAATATLIQTKPGEQAAISAFNMGTDGSGYEHLIVPQSGCRSMDSEDAAVFTDHAGNVRDASRLYMNGPEILKFTLQKIPGLCKETLELGGLGWDSIDMLILHQANRFLLEALRKKIGIASERFLIELEHVGNTVSSSIPLALAISIEKGWDAEQKTVLLAGFGVGYSWGACIIRFDQKLIVKS